MQPVAYYGVVPDVHIRHHQVAATQPRQHRRRPPFRARHFGHIFTNLVVVAELAASRLPGILQILRSNSQARKRPHLVPSSKRRMPIEHHVRHQLAALTQHNMLANRAVRANRAARRYHCTFSHYRRRMNAHSAFASTLGAFTRGTSAAVKVASDTSLPSTVISPFSFTIVVRQFSTVTSIRNWSPGVTGLRKRAS